MDSFSDVVSPRISAGRLDEATLASNFADAHPALTDVQARIEADRCFYCFDAPCIEACPTGIDIPSFIARIADNNLRGSAETILSANIFGGSCARVCPTEILCEQACVRTKGENKPVQIGLLQRHATDHLMRSGEQPFQRAPETGRHVAVVGAGPAGLACAHRLAMLGHRVTVYEARAKGGGLNEYGVAAYKLPGDYAQRELDFILGIGGIEILHGRALGRDITLRALRDTHDAVFLGLGHQAVRALNLSPEPLKGVFDAARFIEMLRQSDKSKVAVGDNVLVIGGGNTAIDAAMQAKRLGAREVTIAYRRGLEHMSATAYERDWARTSGIRILPWRTPTALLGDGGVVTGVLFEDTGDGPMPEPADMVLLAVGQLFDPAALAEADAPRLENGRIAVDADGRTSLDRIWAGGDCTAGADLTVAAVQDGKLAAIAIHQALSGEN
ncbi:NAD(P)-dependent oxidoreductase [Acetobacteraceae bacterium KSS8]|uniref:dihydrouracil dehydrogenase (NAD(+)) n=1 Tax=Endosaccharibacter trunci TaxID=2812733 RepID=A0ABT1WC74_9PROT|nr:NAD(P)-dependent oxidoreductase [Acetobacteraceae bacterium KSS8]